MGAFYRIFMPMDDNKDTRELQEGSAYANLPTTIFIIPMRGCPVFPGLFTTIEVSDKQDIDIIRHCEQYNGFGLVMVIESFNCSINVQFR